MNKFLTPLRVELVDDLANNGQGEWRLWDKLIYEDKKGNMHVVPTGYSCDFASVPRLPFAYWFTGNTAHRPAVLHDYYCDTQSIPREDADNLFREAMESIGMPTLRVRMMHRAVATYRKIKGVLWKN